MVAAVAVVAALVAVLVANRGGATVIRVGSKNFTEQIVLGEILAQAIESRAGSASSGV